MLGFTPLKNLRDYQRAREIQKIFYILWVVNYVFIILGPRNLVVNN